MKKIYTGRNVFDAAMDRIATIHDLYDEIYIKFSGGKDSLVVLKLFELYRMSRGITDKLKVIFHDEEVIPTAVVDFCQKTMESGRYDFQWVCCQMESEKFILGKKEPYIQWDESRQWIRQKPEWSIYKPGVYDQYSMASVYCDPNVNSCEVLGIRAQESINRLRGVFAGGNIHAFINKSNKGQPTTVKPIYDWSEKDIFKFIYEYNIDYCQAYNNQIFNGDKLRVSTPLHAESSRTALLTLKTNDPVFYDQLMEVFPEVELQVRYFKDAKKSVKDFSKYDRSWIGILQFVKDVVHDDMQDKVSKEVMRLKERREYFIELNDRPLGGYPLLYVFEEIAAGRYKRYIAPMHDSQIKEKHYEFERNS